jgi:hypothetical protein
LHDGKQFDMMRVRNGWTCELRTKLEEAREINLKKAKLINKSLPNVGNLTEKCRECACSDCSKLF